MAMNPKFRLPLIIGGSLLILAAVGLTVFRAPGANIEGIGGELGISGEVPAQDFATSVELLPVTINGNEFSAGDLGVVADDLPTIPRAWDFAAWGKTYSGKVTVDSTKLEAALSTIDGYKSPTDAQLAMVEDTWTVTPGENGLKLDGDLSQVVLEAVRKDSKKVELQLQETTPTLTTETVQSVADHMNAASLEVLAGNSSVVTFTGARLNELIELTPTGDHFELSVKSDAVSGLARLYAEDLNRERVDGEQVVDEEGKVLKTIEEPRDGFIPASEEELKKSLEESLAKLLETPNPAVQLPGEVDPAKPNNLMRTAMVDVSDHTAYFYENGVEVARFPIAVGKPGYDTNRGTFKVYTQLTSQNMGSCDSRGNYRPGGSFDYCTANVPWVTYFNGDEGFHGTYWHNNFGNPSSNMSHGCVNMREDDAKWTYGFLQTGSTVVIQD